MANFFAVKSVYFLNAATTPCFSNETLNTWEMTERLREEEARNVYVFVCVISFAVICYKMGIFAM